MSWRFRVKVGPIVADAPLPDRSQKPLRRRDLIALWVFLAFTVGPCLLAFVL